MNYKNFKKIYFNIMKKSSLNEVKGDSKTKTAKVERSAEPNPEKVFEKLVEIFSYSAFKTWGASEEHKKAVKPVLEAIEKKYGNRSIVLTNEEIKGIVDFIKPLLNPVRDKCLQYIIKDVYTKLSRKFTTTELAENKNLVNEVLPFVAAGAAVSAAEAAGLTVAQWAGATLLTLGAGVALKEMADNTKDFIAESANAAAAAWTETSLVLLTITTGIQISGINAATSAPAIGATSGGGTVIPITRAMPQSVPVPTTGSPSPPPPSPPEPPSDWLATLKKYLWECSGYYFIIGAAGAILTGGAAVGTGFAAGINRNFKIPDSISRYLDPTKSLEMVGKSLSKTHWTYKLRPNLSLAKRWACRMWFWGSGAAALDGIFAKEEDKFDTTRIEFFRRAVWFGFAGEYWAIYQIVNTLIFGGRLDPIGDATNFAAETIKLKPKKGPIDQLFDLLIKDLETDYPEIKTLIPDIKASFEEGEINFLSTSEKYVNDKIIEYNKLDYSSRKSQIDSLIKKLENTKEVIEEVRDKFNNQGVIFINTIDIGLMKQFGKGYHYDQKYFIDATNKNINETIQGLDKKITTLKEYRDSDDFSKGIEIVGWTREGKPKARAYSAPSTVDKEKQAKEEESKNKFFVQLADAKKRNKRLKVYNISKPMQVFSVFKLYGKNEFSIYNTEGSEYSSGGNPVKYITDNYAIKGE